MRTTPTPSRSCRASGSTTPPASRGGAFISAPPRVLVSTSGYEHLSRIVDPLLLPGKRELCGATIPTCGCDSSLAHRTDALLAFPTDATPAVPLTSEPHCTLRPFPRRGSAGPTTARVQGAPGPCRGQLPDSGGGDPTRRACRLSGKSHGPRAAPSTCDLVRSAHSGSVEPDIRTPSHPSRRAVQGHLELSSSPLVSGC